MIVGQAVLVEVFGGRIVERIASEVIENKAIIVTIKEWIESVEEGRPARGVGYDISNVQLA